MPWENIVAGALSGAFSRLVTEPFDVLKIRLQLQLEPISWGSKSSKYHSFIDALKTIPKEEGISALWKGFIPGEALYIVYGAVQFPVYERVKNWLSTNNPTLNSTALSFISGSVAGTTAMTVSFPFDVLRTRMIGQGNFYRIYPNSFKAVILMYHERGIYTFYRGLSAALTSIAPQAGIRFGSYSLFTNIWNTVVPKESGIMNLQSMICGATAGIFTKTIMLPIDTTKKRLEVRGFEKARRHFGRVGKYNGLIHCFLTIFREEGIRGLYKGITPTLLKASLTTSMSFTVYDYSLKIVKSLK